MKVKFLLILSLMIIAMSCQKENDLNNYRSQKIPESREIRSLNYNSYRPIILGEEISNPYTLTIVNQANRKLYPGRADLSATHNYLRFIPQNQQDLVDLLDWGHEHNLVMFDFPLHYEVLQEGDYYIDPNVQDSLLNYQYASVPVGYGLPDVQYEQLEELYLDETNPFLFIETYVMTGHGDILYDLIGSGIHADLVEEYYPMSEGPCDQVPPKPDCPADCEAFLVIEEIEPEKFSCYWICICDEDSEQALNECDCPIPQNTKIPAGCVKVENSSAGADEAVALAKVQIWDWIFMFKKSEIAYTNEKGCWQASKEYSEYKMKVVFENRNLKVRDTDYWWSLRVVRDRTRVDNALPYNDSFVRFDENNDRREWAAAHTLNTDFSYRTSAFSDKIALPRKRLNYTLHEGTAPGSAPMLQGNAYNSWIALLLEIHLPALTLSTTSLHPDITNQYSLNETPRFFNATGFHELGHASHHAIVGESYWHPYRNHIINNNGYGTFPDFIGDNAGIVALGEAVGAYAGNKYGGASAGGEFQGWVDNFIPSGLFYDLNDNIDDIVRDPNDSSESIVEMIDGFSPEMMFNALEGPTDIRTYREKLKLLHLEDTTNDPLHFDEVFDVYDVFN